MAWNHHVTIKHLMTEKEDLQSVQESMKAIADTLKNDICFFRFNFKKFYEIPEGNDVIAPVDYANVLLDKLYDYADEYRIWIG